jgi:hypothetical protein
MECSVKTGRITEIEEEVKVEIDATTGKIVEASYKNHQAGKEQLVSSNLDNVKTKRHLSAPFCT